MFHRQASEPVATYGDALSWLFTHTRVEDWLFDENANLPDVARLVASMFWVNETDLVRDLRRLWNTSLAPAPVAAPLRKRSRWR